jgi:hypothetical protein
MMDIDRAKVKLLRERYRLEAWLHQRMVSGQALDVPEEIHRVAADLGPKILSLEESISRYPSGRRGYTLSAIRTKLKGKHGRWDDDLETCKLMNDALEAWASRAVLSNFNPQTTPSLPVLDSRHYTTSEPPGGIVPLSRVLHNLRNLQVVAAKVADGASTVGTSVPDSPRNTFSAVEGLMDTSSLVRIQQWLDQDSSNRPRIPHPEPQHETTENDSDIWFRVAHATSVLGLDMVAQQLQSDDFLALGSQLDVWGVGVLHGLLGLDDMKRIGENFTASSLEGLRGPLEVGLGLVQDQLIKILLVLGEAIDFFFFFVFSSSDSLTDVLFH